MKRILIAAIFFSGVIGVRAQLFDTSAAQLELVATLIGTGRVVTANVAVTRERNKKQAKIADNVIYLRNGDLRIEHKLADEPSLAKLTAKLKKNELAEVVTILLPKANKAYLVLPGKKSYLESPVVNAAEKKGQASHTESKFLRVEGLDGHSCTVRRLTIIESDESRQEIVIWEATDLDNLIIKSEMDHGDDTMEALRFNNLRFDKPGDDKFALPPKYRKLSAEDAGGIAETMMEFDLDRDAAVAEALR